MPAGTVHGMVSQPPADPATYAEAASAVTAMGLDMGNCRRVGYARFCPTGIEVVSFFGDVCTFSNDIGPYVQALEPGAKGALLERILDDCQVR